MDDAPIDCQRDRVWVSTDRRRLNLDTVLEMLHNTHWGSDVTRAILERAVANSLCFGMYEGATQLGFARVVTDLATYGYLTDVVIVESRWGQGLGEWLVDCILAHPDLQRLRRLALLTRDSPDLYARFGFTPGPGSQRYMELLGGGAAVRRLDA